MTAPNASESSQVKTAPVPKPRAVDDFYNYVNADWLNDPKNEIPNEYSLWGGFTKLHDEGLKKQIAILEELTASSPEQLTDEERKIAAIWNASMHLRFAKWEKGEGDLTELVKELCVLDEYLPDDLATSDRFIGAIADYFWYTQKAGISNVLDLDKGSDLKQVNNVVLDISACGLSLPSREYYTEENFAEKRNLFKEHLGNVKGLIAAAGFDLGDSFVDDVLAFENVLSECAMKREHAREYHRYFTNTSLDDIASSKINELKYLDEKEEYYAEDDRRFTFDDDQVKRVAQFFQAVYSASSIKATLEKKLGK